MCEPIRPADHPMVLPLAPAHGARRGPTIGLSVPMGPPPVRHGGLAFAFSESNCLSNIAYPASAGRAVANPPDSSVVLMTAVWIPPDP